MNPSLSQQRRLIAVSAIVTLGVGYIAGVRRGEELPTARFLVGIGFAFMVCSIFIDLGSSVGAGFAVLIMLSTILYNSEDVVGILDRFMQKPKPKRGKGKKAPTKPLTAREVVSDSPFANPNSPFYNWLPG